MSRQYMINIWSKAGQAGVALLYRTEDYREWLRRIRELKNEYGITKRMCRTVEYDSYTIFSFASNHYVEPAWLEMEYVKTPISVRFGFPYGIDEKE